MEKTDLPMFGFRQLGSTGQSCGEMAQMLFSVCILRSNFQLFPVTSTTKHVYYAMRTRKPQASHCALAPILSTTRILKTVLFYGSKNQLYGLIDFLQIY